MKRSKEWKEPVPVDTAKAATRLRLFMLGSPSFFFIFTETPWNLSSFTGDELQFINPTDT